MVSLPKQSSVRALLLFLVTRANPGEKCRSDAIPLEMDKRLCAATPTLCFVYVCVGRLGRAEGRGSNMAVTRGMLVHVRDDVLYINMIILSLFLFRRGRGGGARGGSVVVC
ncbi:unnamed protein product, partial [Ascophyllum nodosum]